MLHKTLGWTIAAVCAVGVVWWLLDPVGFANNPVISYLKRISLQSSEFFGRLFPTASR
jgi:hypothetical protein